MKRLSVNRMSRAGRLRLLLLPLLGVMLLSHGAVADMPRDAASRREAVRQVAEGAARGDAESLYQLSMLYAMGYDSIPRDTVRSLDLLIESARAGSVKGANLLGYKLIRGEGMERDFRAGMAWIERAARAGDPMAQSNIGYFLLQADSAYYDPAAAVVWLEKAAAGGVPEARSMLGDIYLEGIGVAPDTLRAEQEYREAYTLGLRDAAYKLAALYESIGADRSDSQSLEDGLFFYSGTAPQLGVAIFRRLAEATSTDSVALAGAEAAVDGRSLPCGSVADDERALRAHAKALLGDAYTRGRGVGYDHSLSTRYYFEAACEGDPSAQFVIGELLDIFPDSLDSLLDDTLPSDAATAPYWYERAASAGVRDAAEAMRRLLRQ